MRVLLSTFGRNDFDAVIQAMRSLAYDKLVLIGERGICELPAFMKLKRLEEVSGHALDAEELGDDGFLALVDSISEVLQKLARGGKDVIVLNISGGTKLIGDAAMLAGFRNGVETYISSPKLVKLPILKGVTAKDRFTASQLQMITALGTKSLTLDELASEMRSTSRQTVDRCLRDLRNQNLLSVSVKPGRVSISLSESGLEVLRAARIASRAGG